ncbi:MAG: hypothetical protein NTW49_13245 [Bacteroidia bacterium]|nr:hypothetical protein [Bacteroidia bacterium]
MTICTQDNQNNYGNSVKMWRIVMVIILILISNHLFSQTLKSFTAEDQKFLSELQGFMENGDKENGKAIFNEFQDFWNTIGFSQEDKENIFSTCNALLKKKALAKPHYADYLHGLMTIKKSPMEGDNYTVWQTALSFFLNDKPTRLNKIDLFLVTCNELIKTNTLNQSTGIRWNCSNPDFKFVFNDTVFKVEFEKTDLVCHSKDDSLKIFNTSGIFLPVAKTWKGKTGMVYWERSGLSRDSVFAALSKYNIQLNKSNYQADSVKLTNLNFSNQPMAGRLEDKIVAAVKEDKISYPRFKSYEKRMNIKNLYPGIDFEGSFSIHGSRLISENMKGEDAYLKISYKGRQVMTASSKSFIFKKNLIVGPNTAICIKIDTDSIYHPGLLFKYYAEKNEVHLIRNGEGMSKSPWFNTYHQVDMDFELVTWKITDPKMNFGMLKGGETKPAVFESVNFFSGDKYRELQMMDKEHPFVLLSRFSKKMHSDEFTAKEYCDYLNMPFSEVRQQLMQMSYLGVISFDEDNDLVKVRSRLFNYLKASAGKIDYDVISFVSNVDTLVNASFSLLTYDLKIKGVPRIDLSDSQNVVIYPLDGNLLLKKNRDFEFDGKVRAGLFDFFGKKFDFSYNMFKVDLNNIDSLNIWVKSDKYDKLSRQLLVKVKTVITDVTGDLLIDDPLNKSSLKKHPEYPIFNSKRNSFVYYDKRSIQKGVYKRDKFYFMIFPYSIDSLNTFTTKGLRFAGNFTSAGIFPPFDENLKVQKDLSLGFVRSTPPEGYNTYGNKGIYKNIIDLSNKGLHGNGELRYLSSVTNCDNFIFYPDSTNGDASKFTNEKKVSGVEYPAVEGENVHIHWMPYEDEFICHKKEIPLAMYDKEAILHGFVKLTPTGMSGNGKMEFENAELSSDEFRYKSMTFVSDSAKFNLKETTGDFSFMADNVQSYVDFNTRKGKFVLNDKEKFVEFPQNQYICSMDVFNWYMDKAEIDMSVSSLADANHEVTIPSDPTELAGLELDGSKFVSTHPAQDSLSFVASLANYKIKEHLITAYNVRTIIVGDATVLPGDGIVIVEKKAIMRPLENAKIVANNDTKYHTIYNSEVNIFGKKKYEATGDYDYVDELKLKQKIHFTSIRLNDSLNTIATGSLSDTLNFTLSPDFIFRGNVKLNAPREFLTFTGSVKMTYSCSKIANNWLKFSTEINPEEIMIPVADNPVDLNKDKLVAGFEITKDSAHIYTSFLNKPKKSTDDKVLTSGGYLIFDKTSGEYQVASKERLDNPGIAGNFLSLGKKSCKSYGEGPINLGVYTGQVKINSSGSISHDLVKDSVEMNLMMTMDFFFPKELLSMLSGAITQAGGLDAADLSSDTYIKGLTFLMGKEKAEKALKELSLYGKYQSFPDELDKTIVFTNLYMKWNPRTKSYVSEGGLSISNIMKNEVDRNVDGKIEFSNKRTGNEFTLYIVIGYDKWYFLNYSRNTLGVLSSDEKFNQALRDIKPKNRKNEIKGEPPLSIVPATDRKRRDFIRKFNIEEESDNKNNKEN